MEAFLYFYGFFHRSAFEEHPLGVAALLRESADYARGVSETLKAQVYDALRHLAQGFLLRNLSSYRSISPQVGICLSDALRQVYSPNLEKA